jgi:hypothetical protein
MPDAIAYAAAAMLSLAFVWAALAKLARFSGWRAALAGYGLPTPVAIASTWGVPVTELAAAALLVAAPPKAGAALVLALLAVFSLAVVGAQREHGDKLPCGCFGRAEARDYRAIVGRNALLGVLAAIVLLSEVRAAAVTMIELPGSDEVVPAILVVAGIAAVVTMASQVGGAFRRKENR